MVKAPKDANAPKKPLTPFFAWREKNYTRVVKSMKTGYSFKELSQKISEEWNKLSEADKQSFKDTFAEQRTKYEKLFKAYKLTGNYQKYLLVKAEFKDESAKKKQKFRKDENAPKRPATAYFCFMAEKREIVKAQHPTLAHKELVTKMAKMWGELTEEEKKPYQTEADKKKKSYEKEMAVYKKSDEYKQYQKEKLEHKEQVKTLSAKKVKAPKKEKKAKSPKAKSPKAKKVKKAKAKSPKAKSPKAKKARKARKATKVKKGARKPKAPKRSARKATKSKSKSTKSKATKSRKAKKASSK